MQTGLKLLLRGVTIIISSCILCMMATACKPTSDAAAQTVSKDESALVSDTMPVKKGEQIRLIVSLLSAGEGPDKQAVEQLNNQISDYNKETKKEIQYVMVSWGREGETDFCFRLSTLDSKQQKVFIDKLKQQFANRSLIIISENVACNHIR